MFSTELRWYVFLYFYFIANSGLWNPVGVTNPFFLSDFSENNLFWTRIPWNPRVKPNITMLNPNPAWWYWHMIAENCKHTHEAMKPGYDRYEQAFWSGDSICGEARSVSRFTITEAKKMSVAAKHWLIYSVRHTYLLSVSWFASYVHANFTG